MHDGLYLKLKKILDPEYFLIIKPYLTNRHFKIIFFDVPIPSTIDNIRAGVFQRKIGTLSCYL